MQLVYEQDDLALGLPYLVHDGFEALFELAPELGSRHQRAHIEGEHAAFPQLLWGVFRDDALRETLGDGRLAHAGASDQHRVVLGAPDEGLHDP